MEARMVKKLLRQQALARRDSLDPVWRNEMSVRMAHAAILVRPGMIVSGFWPMRSEVDVRPLMAALGEAGAQLCLPAILDRQTIVFRQYRPGMPLVDMGFGTLGPGPEAAELDPELILMPLAAFDRRGHRIGYGAGYYDRAIARLHAAGKTPRLVAIAYDCQQVDRVPDEPHDVQLAEILTESGLRHFPLGL